MYSLPSSCFVLVFLLSFFHHLPCASSKQELGWCQVQFQCGNITAGFPFWGGNRSKVCGHPLLELHCNKSTSASIIISDEEYHVLHLNQISNTLTLARPEILGSFCNSVFTNTTLPPGIFELSPTYKSLFVYYHCSRPPRPFFSSYACSNSDNYPDTYISEYYEDHRVECANNFTVNVPTSFATTGEKLNMADLKSVLRNGFEVNVMTDEKTRHEYNHRFCRAPFSCGNQRRLLYPFWIPGREDCGHPDFKLNCSRGFAELNISDVKFRILEANYDSGVIRLARRSDYINITCPEYSLNVPFNENVLPFAPGTELLTVYYSCRQEFSPPVSIYVGELDCEDEISYYVTKNLSSPLLQGLLNNFTGSCDRNISVPASGPALNTLQRSPNPDNLKMAVEQGFELEVNSDCRMCVNSGGACGYNQTSSVFVCYCKDGAYKRTCGDKVEEPHRRCSAPFSCGDQGGLLYPFWIPGREDCGHPDFRLNCSGRFAEIGISSVKYRILEATYDSRIIRLARSEYIGNLCPQDPSDTPFDENVLPFAPKTELLTIYYDCGTDISLSVSTYVGDLDCQKDVRSYYVTRNLASPLLQGITTLLNDFRRICRRNVSIPASRPMLNTLERNTSTNNLKKVLEEGFELKVNQECLMCIKSKGACGYNQTSRSFVCYCYDGSENYTCGSRIKGLSTGAKAGVGAALALVGVIILIVAGLLCYQRKTSDEVRKQNLKALIPLKHYSYAKVERITKSFAEVVGKGGFGIVYKGTLPDGRTVAVKILKDSKGNGEDFINEVASMSKTSHVNIVSLLGFCSEGSKRAIIYEYLENGSLDQFISNNTSMDLDWMAMYGIALGVARGLEYLHHGCKTRIVHFDIKPQNVLLDDNLCPKVSDFGLAKLCEKKESTLSLLNTRGTIGYIAPEVFSRMYGRVSHKSDVYSYGMLLLEMIGARKKERVEQNSASNTSSMYFPEWIYKDLEKGDIGRLIENGISTEDEEVAKKMTLVGLWCIQSYPSDRPAMNRVVEMMEGNLDALEVPPRPVFQIPTAPLQESSTLSEEVSINVA